MGSCVCVFYHVFEKKHFMFSRIQFSAMVKNWMSSPIWSPFLESQNIIRKTGWLFERICCFFSQFVVEWRNTTLTDGSVNFCKICKLCFDDRILVPIDSFHPKFHVINQNLMKGFITSVWFGKDMIGMEVERRPKSLQNF